MQAHILVLTNRTAVSEDLLAALQDRAAQRPSAFDLVMPPERDDAVARSDAQRRLEAALAKAREAGLEVTGRVGDCDALVAATEAYDATRHDEILISTLPASTSHWLQIDLPARVAHATGALVSHVVARAPRPPAAAVHHEPPPRPGLLAPLNVLGWARRRREPKT
jgi:hypothetical protein